MVSHADKKAYLSGFLNATMSIENDVHTKNALLSRTSVEMEEVANNLLALAATTRFYASAASVDILRRFALIIENEAAALKVAVARIKITVPFAEDPADEVTSDEEPSEDVSADDVSAAEDSEDQQAVPHN